MGIRDFYRAQEDGKAFGYRVELTDAGGALYSGGAPASYNDYNGLPAGGRTQTPLSQRAAPIHMQTYGGRESIDWLFKAINRVATSASKAGYYFEDDAGNRLVPKKSPTDAPDVKLAPTLAVNLFKEPNPYMDWADLCELALIDWLIVGNAYWVKWPITAPTPLALYRMCPEHVKIIPDQFGPSKYRYQLPGEREYTDFTPDQVVHFKRPNPHDPYYGMGLVQGNARPLDMELALTATAAHYYENRGLPSGVVSTDRRVPRDVFRKLKTQMNRFYGGPQSAGMLMVLEAGLKYDSVSPSAADALFGSMGQWSRDRVLSMFNLNKGLLGIQDDPGDPKLADWQLIFDRETMIPVTQRFSKAISRALVRPLWGIDFCIDYEETLTPDVQLSRAQTLAPLPGVKVKELRAAAGLNPSTGDKEIDETVLNMPQPNLDATGQGGAPDANLKNEPGRPPLAANTSSFGSTSQAPAQRKASGKTRSVGVSPKPGKKSLEEIVNEIDTKLMLMDSKAVTTPPGLFLVEDEAKATIKRALTALERGLLDAIEQGDGTTYSRVKGSKAWTKFRRDATSALEEAHTEALSHTNVQRLKRGESALEASELQAFNVSDTVETLTQQVLDSILTSQRAGEGDSEGAVRSAIQAADAAVPAAVEVALTAAPQDGVA